MKPKFLIGLALPLFFLIVFTMVFFEYSVGPPESMALASLTFPEKTLTVTIADTPGERLQGLSGKKNLPSNEAMLFVWEKSGQHGIWMKEMNFPIDIIWLNKDFEIVHIAPYISPETYPKVFSPNKPSRYVLEIKAGLAAQMGLQKDDKLNITGLQKMDKSDS